MKIRYVWALALAAALAPGAHAQLASGNVYGSVADASGAVLPGASITLTGAQVANRSTVSGAGGDFRFLSLDPGTYKLAVSLTGFSTVQREIVVNTGANVNLSFSLKVASVEETLTVQAAPARCTARCARRTPSRTSTA